MLATFLADHPEAMVAAIDPGPTGLFTTPPSTLDLEGRVLLQGRNALDIVVPSDRVVVIEAWEEARASGVGRSVVHLAVDPADPALLTLVDARAAHGVFVGAVIPAPGQGDRPLVAHPTVRLPSRIGRMEKSELAVILAADETMTRILGCSEADLVGRRTLELLHPDDQEAAIRDWMQLLEGAGSLPPVRQRLRRADGTWAWFEVVNHNHLADPDRGCVLSELVDVSQEMAAETALRAREQLLRRLTEALPIGVLQAGSDGGVVYTNDRLHRLLRTPPALTVADQLAAVAPEDRPALQAAVEASLRAGMDDDLELSVLPPGGPGRRFLIRIRSLSDEAGAPAGAVLVVEDVTESSRLRAALEDQATRDPLTGTLNRASVLAAVERLLAAELGALAVIFVDLDRFKSINDLFGHQTGDDLLRVAADRLRSALRDHDSVGRIGGDEFLVVCPGVRTAEHALRVGERIARAMGTPVALGGRSLDLRASLGVALGDAGTEGADSLVARADAAMYASKRAGRGDPVLAGFEPDPADVRGPGGGRPRPTRMGPASTRATASTKAPRLAPPGPSLHEDAARSVPRA